MVASVYSFFRGDFPDVEFFASRRYVHVTKEGLKESLFDLTEAPAYQRAVMQPIYGIDAENRIGGSDEKGNFPDLPSGKI